jgi:hypothetical protein
MKTKQPNYKSKFEATVSTMLPVVNYEPDKIKFTQPEKQRVYIPDFKLDNDVYLECKGRWTYEDRAKHLWLKEQHPEITIYILFQNSSVKLNKKSKTSYGDWATKNGLQWADFRNGIPTDWLTTHESKQSNRDPAGRSTGKPKPKGRRTTAST